MTMGWGQSPVAPPPEFEVSNGSIVNILSDIEFINSYNLTDTTWNFNNSTRNSADGQNLSGPRNTVSPVVPKVMICW